MRKPDRPKSGVIFRCLIYTRKSSEEGLEQEFNSLGAQREACEAYVTSQRHAGWIASAGPSLHHSSFANSCDPWSSRSRLARPKSWCGSVEPRSCRA